MASKATGVAGGRGGAGEVDAFEPYCVAWSRAGLAVGTLAGVALWTPAGATMRKAAGMRTPRTVALSDNGALLVGVEGKTAWWFGPADAGAPPAVIKLVGKKIGAAGLVSLTRDGAAAIHARVVHDGKDGHARTGRALSWLSAFAAADSVIIATGDFEDKALRRVDLDGRTLATFALDEEPKCLATAADADAWAVGLSSGAAAIFDAGSPATPKVVTVCEDYEVTSIAMTRDGRRVAAGGYLRPREGEPEGGARVFTEGVADDIVVPFSPPWCGNGLAFSPDGSRLAAVLSDSAVRVTELAAGAAAGERRTWELFAGDKGTWCVRAGDGRIDGPGVAGVTGAAAPGLLAEMFGRHPWGVNPAVLQERAAH